MSEAAPIQAVIVPVTPFQQNCSLLWCSESMKGAVVDPGGDLDRILTAATERHVEIEKFPVTHGHVDHSGNAAAALVEQLGVPIEGPHPDDSFCIDRTTEQGEQWSLLGVRPFSPTRWLRHGDRGAFGKVELAVLHCSGHTPGHGQMSNFAAERESNPFVSDAALQASAS